MANLKDQLWGHRGGGWWRPPCLCLVLEICLEKDGMDDIFMEIAVLFTFHDPCYVFWEVGSPLSAACWSEIIFHVRNISYVAPRVLPLNISGCGMGLVKSHDTSIFAMKMHWAQISCANLSIVLVLIQLSLGWFKADIVQETHGYSGCLPPKMGLQPQIFQGRKSASMPEAQAFLEILKQKRPELLRWTGEWLGMSPGGL